ncbi:MAG: glycosyltransferase [Armatimonadetes bacterium]|nr:glycosyltransferase [Armatimonadota bacterium]
MTGGGAERQLSYLASGLISLGHQVDIGYIHDGPAAAEVDFSGCRLHKLKAKGNYEPGTLIQILHLIKATKPDIIQTWILQMDVCGGLAVRFTNIPWIIREPSSEGAYYGSWKQRLRRRLAKRSECIVCNSKGGQDFWKEHYPNKSCDLIPNGLQLANIDAASMASDDEYDISADKKLIVYAGRLEPVKKLNYLLDACKKVFEQTDSIAIFCGEGSSRPELERQILGLGISPKVRLTGYLPTSKVWGLMKRADVFAFISALEGMPNVVMEAMACGAPLVVSDIPAHREVLDEQRAIFVNPSDSGTVADAIMNCLSDRAGAKQRAILAREKAEQWSIMAMAKKYEAVYIKILRGR